MLGGDDDHQHVDTQQDGVVSSWNGSYGFIQFSDGRRAYVHSSACGGSPLTEGQAVRGFVVPDPRNPGKWGCRSIESAVPIADHHTDTVAYEGVSASEYDACYRSLTQGMEQSTWDKVQFVAPDCMEQGVVTRWTQNYGFVQFSDGRRAYVHTSQCNGAALVEGEAVNALVVEDPRNPGKWQATNVQRLDPTQMGGKVHGYVSKWSGSYGFIEFSDGRKAYVHQSQCSACGGTLTEGQAVAADVAEDAKNIGKWQAMAVVLPHATERSSAGASIGGVNHSSGVKLQGVVSQWSGSYGFIKLEDGRRAYVHISQCSRIPISIVEGQEVAANVVEDPKNPGKWQAMDVVPSSSAGKWPATDFVPTSSAGSMTTHYPQEASWQDSAKVSGVVKQWSGSFGFIEFHDGRRAYVHTSQCSQCGGALAEGQPVAADVVEDPRNPGKWQAVDVMPASPQRTPPNLPSASSWHTGAENLSSFAEADPGVKQPGLVSQWTGSYGFIKFDDGRRAYVHASQCSRCGGTLSDGQKVVADVVEDPKNPGKWQAMDVMPQTAGKFVTVFASPVARNATASQAKRPAPARSYPGKAEGVVSQWGVGSPYGFIQFSDGRRAYVHISQCGGQSLAEGQAVKAVVAADPKNADKWQAMNVESANSSSNHYDGILSGTVAQWNSSYGFITLQDGTRAYVHTSECGGAQLGIGEVVSCYLTADAKNPGKWCATGIMRDAGAAGASSPWGDAASEGTQTGGTITKWNDKGWGLATMDDGRSAYVHASQCPLGECLREGDLISAVVQTDKKNPGRWCLVCVEIQDANPLGEPPAKRGRFSAFANDATLMPQDSLF